MVAPNMDETPPAAGCGGLRQPTFITGLGFTPSLFDVFAAPNDKVGWIVCDAPTGGLALLYPKSPVVGCADVALALGYPKRIGPGLALAPPKILVLIY